MKKIVFILSALVGFLNTTAQTYFSADLESGIDSWTIVDSDGDGNNWSVIDFDDNEGSVLNSASYDNQTGPLTPDNWIITPAINLAASNAPSLYWKAKAQDPTWVDENYSVYVSTQSDVNSLSGSSVSFSEVIGVTNGYELRTLDLSSFNNETVYVAFRHHDVTDMFSLNIKDISVSEILQEFVEHDISSSNYQVVDAEGGTGTFDFTVTSFGTDNLSDYDFNYTINGSPSSIASNQILSVGGQESFSFDLGIGEYTVATSVTNSNGEVLGQEQEFSLFVVPPVPNFTLEDIYGNSHDLHEALSKGKTVVLDFFASWCGPCEASTPEVNSIWNQFGAGDEDFEVYGLTTETTDDAAVISGLGWGAEYPKFEYSYDAYLQYFHYASSLETSGIPLYVLVCPNTQNPGFSEVSWFSEGWAPGGQSQNDMVAALQECDASIGVEEFSVNQLSVYPNPAKNSAFVEFNLVESNEVLVELTNALGQKVFTNSSTMNAGFTKVELPVADLNSGIYIVNISIAGKLRSEKLNILK